MPDEIHGTAAAGSGHAVLLTNATVLFTLAGAVLVSAPLLVSALPVLALSGLAGISLLTATSFGAAGLTDGARSGGWMQPVLAVGGGVLVAAVVASAWNAQAEPSHVGLMAAGGGMLVSAFPALVLERFVAAMGGDGSPWGRGLIAMLRAVLLLQLSLGLGLLLQAGGFGFAAAVPRACAMLVLLIAGEFVLRGIAAVFLPASAEVRPAAVSAIASCINWRLAQPESLNQAIVRQWGIDLSQSWALRFAGRAIAPIGVFMAVLAWGLSGVVALPLDQRAVYQRFGRPAGIMGPGLHLTLPWPFGISRRVERGVLHELNLSEPIAAADARDTRPNAEDVPPQSTDRLWDRPHPGEATYLTASRAAAGQGFQQVDVDLRLITRIGLSDSAAEQATWGVVDTDTLVRATAGQYLVRYFASRTLADVLGENRQTFTAEAMAALQRDVDRLGLGVEIVAIVVEAIHPPPAVADAWHAVATADIKARIAVAQEHGAAAKTASAARIATASTALAAGAATREIIANANRDRILFSADATAYAAQPDAFQLERWLSHVRSALPATQLLVLDHRLAGVAMPTLDLRDLTPAGPVGR